MDVRHALFSSAVDLKLDQKWMLQSVALYLQAHKSQLTSMLGTGGAVVTTGILGTVRMWHAEDVARDVERAGLNCDARPTTLRRASATTGGDACQSGGCLHQAGMALPCQLLMVSPDALC
jgi:hypothetical protein